MMKCIKQLLRGERTNVGNHRCEEARVAGHEVERFIYFSTAICTVNHSLKTFVIDNGGYDTMSTNRAINDYRSHFKREMNYFEVFEYYYLLLRALLDAPDNHSTTVFYGDLHLPTHCITIQKETDEDGKKKATIAITGTKHLFNPELTDNFDPVVFTVDYKGYKTLANAIKPKLESIFTE